MPENQAPDNQGQTTGPAAAVKEKPAPPKVDRLPPFRVLLHNDDVNDIEFVLRSLVGLTPLRQEAAAKVTIEAHRSGVALVLVTHRELAEFYQERLGTRKLTVTIEPAD